MHTNGKISIHSADIFYVKMSIFNGNGSTAFDVGRAFSGYAFSLRDSPFNIKTNQGWSVGSQQLISLKTSTCVMLKPNTEFHSFRLKAENHYSKLAEDDKHPRWFLFRHFKTARY